LTYTKVGKITHYFDKIQVAVLQVTDGPLNTGDSIRVGEEGVGVEQKVDSMQVEHAQVSVAAVGDEVGLKVVSAVKPGEFVYKVTE
jgi:translation elongation factor EF-1alpha